MFNDTKPTILFFLLLITSVTAKEVEHKCLIPGIDIFLQKNVSQPYFIFCHGFVPERHKAGRKQTESYIAKELIHTSGVSFEFFDSDAVANFGQERDCFLLNRAHQHAKLHFGADTSHLYVGVSRGASCVLTYLAEEQPKNVSAVILESPFAHLKDVIKHIMPWYISWFSDVTFTCIQFKFPNFDPRGVQPETVLEKINTEIPMLFVCTEIDALVPCWSTEKIARRLAELGNNDIYLLKLVDGEHGLLAHHELYQQTVNAFLKRYNLPCNEELAQQGKFLLHDSHLTIPHAQVLAE